MSLLSSAFDGALDSLVVVETSLATPWFPFVHAIIDSSRAAVICVAILHPPSDVLPARLKHDERRIKMVDWTSSVPNYEDVPPGNDGKGLNESVLDAIASALPGPVTFIVDSPDTLRMNLASVSATYTLLQRWCAALASRNAPARVILPFPTHSPLLPLIITPAFSSALVHLTLHPPKLLHYLATEHLAPAPPNPRFWALFASSSAGMQAEQLVWGDKGNGWDSPELVVEALVRRTHGRRHVERVVEGWRPTTGPCALTELSQLRNVWPSTVSPGNRTTPAVDHTHEVSFNLNLTDAQQRARAQVPLPYVHTGSGSDTRGNRTVPVPQGVILYDPDSADDLDDDDPDEDLEI